MEGKKAQISMEYMILIGFITFVVITLFVLAFSYSNGLEDKIKDRQLEDLSNKVKSSAESVYFSGEPSKSTINAYLPNGITNIVIDDNELIFYFDLSSGHNIRSYKSDVPIQGSISSVSGTKIIYLTAQQDYVFINSS